MRRFLKKEYRMYFLMIIFLLLINLAFFFLVTRATSCDPFHMATECLAECGPAWTISDHLFYCDCYCSTELSTVIM
jgi:hypothetical protein